jgi:hypothetical protein
VAVLAADDLPLLIFLDKIKDDKSDSDSKCKKTTYDDSFDYSVISSTSSSEMKKTIMSINSSINKSKDYYASHRHPIPTLVEQKRIGYIVQRSHQKDHWYQLKRMSNTVESIGHGVFMLLLEGNCHKDSQYSQHDNSLENVSSLRQTIYDENTMYRFIVILCHRQGHPERHFIFSRNQLCYHHQQWEKRQHYPWEPNVQERLILSAIIDSHDCR